MHNMLYSTMPWTQTNAFMNFLMLRVAVKVWKLVPRNIILKEFNEFSFSQKFKVLHD
jgi:hypothetical protein